MLMTNPLVKRYSFSLFRKGTIIVVAIIYISVLFIINGFALVSFIANLPKAPLPARFIQELALTIYPWILGIGCVTFWILASLTPASILNSQIIKGSQDFFDILPLKGYQKAIGLLVGANLLFYPLTLISLFLSMQYGLLAGLRPVFQCHVLAFVLGFGLFLNIFSILAGIPSKNIKLKQNNNISGLPTIALLAAIILVGIALIGPLANSNTPIDEIDKLCWDFYFLPIPAMLSCGFISLTVAVFGFIGVARKLNDRKLAYFSRLGAVLFFIYSEFLLLGFFSRLMFAGGNEDFNPMGALCMFVVISFILALLIPMGAIRSKKLMFDSIAHSVKFDAKNPRRYWLKFAQHSNLFVFSTLLILWLIPVIILSFFSEFSALENIVHILTFCAFYIYSMTVIELFVLFQASKWKFHFLVVFFSLTYQVMFFIGGLILKNATILIYSFPGYLICIAKHRNNFLDVSLLEQAIAGIANFILAIALLGGVVYCYYLHCRELKKYGYDKELE